MEQGSDITDCVIVGTRHCTPTGICQIGQCIGQTVSVVACIVCAIDQGLFFRSRQTSYRHILERGVDVTDFVALCARYNSCCIWITDILPSIADAVGIALCIAGTYNGTGFGNCEIG